MKKEIGFKIMNSKKTVTRAGKVANAFILKRAQLRASPQKSVHGHNLDLFIVFKKMKKS